MPGELYVTINGLRLDRAGFCGLLDFGDLLTEGPARGANYAAQGVGGTTFRPKVGGELVAMVQLEVEGQVDKDGVAHANAWAGLRNNIEQIRTSCVVASKAALVTASVTFEDDSVRSAPVECPRLSVGLQDVVGNRAIAVLEIVVPSGALS